MSLPALTIHRPRQIEHATSLLRRLGDDAAVYAGGNELLLELREGDGRHRHLIDVKGIDALCAIEVHHDGLGLGAAVTYRDISRSRLVLEHLPALADLARGIGNVRLRNTATLGGSLCHADPRSEPATFLLAADASVSWAARDGAVGRAKVDEFVRRSFEGGLEAGRLLTAIHVPLLGPDEAIGHRKISLRERPAVTVAAKLAVTGGRIADTRVAVGAPSGAPVLASDAARVLVGERASCLNDDDLAKAGEAAAAAVAPTDDLDGSAEFKRQLVRVLTGRCLRELLESAP
jgi:carbon-monoxide dehydrogenase medium subunit